MCKRALLLVLALAALALPAGAAAETSRVIIELSPESGPTDVHPCNGEAMILSGRIMLVVNEVSTPGGNSHLSTTGVLQGVTATGVDSLVRYKLVGTSSSTFNSDGASVVKIRGTRRIIGQGDVGDFVLTTAFHMTLNANGEPTAVLVRSAFECLTAGAAEAEPEEPTELTIPAATGAAP